MNRFAMAALAAHAYNPLPRIILIPAMAIGVWLIFSLFALLFAPLMAQELATLPAGDTTVVVPYGSWLDNLLSNSLQIVVAAILGIVTIASRRAPAWLAQIIRTLLTEQMLAHAVAFGINAVRGAVKGKSLSLDVGSHVLAQAFDYVIGKAPAWFLNWVGGAENLKTMILARLDMDAEADAQSVLDRVRIVAAGGKPHATVVPGTVMPNGDVLVGLAPSPRR